MPCHVPAPCTDSTGKSTTEAARVAAWAAAARNFPAKYHAMVAAAKRTGPFDPKIGGYPTGVKIPGYGPLYIDKTGRKFVILPNGTKMYFDSNGVPIPPGAVTDARACPGDSNPLHVHTGPSDFVRGVHATLTNTPVSQKKHCDVSHDLADAENKHVLAKAAVDKIGMQRKQLAVKFEDQKRKVHEAKMDRDAKRTAMRATGKHEHARKIVRKAKTMDDSASQQDKGAAGKQVKAKTEKHSKHQVSKGKKAAIKAAKLAIGGGHAGGAPSGFVPGTALNADGTPFKGGPGAPGYKAAVARAAAKAAAVSPPLNADGTPFLGGPGDPGYKAAVARAVAKHAAAHGGGVAGYPEDAGMAAAMAAAKHGLGREDIGKISTATSGKYGLHPNVAAHMAALAAARAARAKGYNSSVVAEWAARAARAAGGDEATIAAAREAADSPHKAAVAAALTAARTCRAQKLPPAQCLALAARAAKAAGGNPADIGKAMSKVACQLGGLAVAAAHFAGKLAAEAAKAAGGDDKVIADVKRAGADPKLATTLLAKRQPYEDGKAGKSPYYIANHAALMARAALGNQPGAIGNAVKSACKAQGVDVHIGAHVAALHAAKAAKDAGMAPSDVKKAAIAGASAAGGDAIDQHHAEVAGADAKVSERLTRKRSGDAMDGGQCPKKGTATTVTTAPCADDVKKAVKSN